MLQWEIAFSPFGPLSAPDFAYREMWGLQLRPARGESRDYLHRRQPGFPGIGPATCRGTVTLTPNVQVNLTGQIDRYMKDHPLDPDKDPPTMQQMTRCRSVAAALPDDGPSHGGAS